ncbi:MAG: hypothetical protein FWD36_06860 [Treponema sp.]|nr:hypothetical protein [Treponema sp.]
MFYLVKRLGFFVAVLMICFLFVNCAYSPPAGYSSDTSNNFIEMFTDGEIKQVDFATSIVTTKDFITLGLIFVESSATIDSNGHIIEGSKITLDMLMREAQKLGADDIINLRIDEIQHITVSDETRIVQTTIAESFYYGQRVIVDTEQKMQIVVRRIDYKANALAIKYTNTIVTP